MKKIIWIASGVVLGIVVIFVVLNSMLSPLEKLNKKGNTEEIYFSDNKGKLFITAQSWGLAGNHEEIILSSLPYDNAKRGDKDKDYIFYTSEIYYKKEGSNKLVIYASQSSVSEPKKFDSPINIVIKALKTSDDLKEYEQNYKKYGLAKISVLEGK